MSEHQENDGRLECNEKTDPAYRKRRIFHIVAGDANWTPTEDELQTLVTLFQEAAFAPVGEAIPTDEHIVAAVATRDGIKCEVLEIPSNADFIAMPQQMAELSKVMQEQGLTLRGIAEALRHNFDFGKQARELEVWRQNLDDPDYTEGDLEEA